MPRNIGLTLATLKNYIDNLSRQLFVINLLRCIHNILDGISLELLPAVERIQAIDFLFDISATQKLVLNKHTERQRYQSKHTAVYTQIHNSSHPLLYP